MDSGAQQQDNPERLVQVSAGSVTLEGVLAIPPTAQGIVLFAHGSGSSRHSPRNGYVSQVLREYGLATLLMDLLTAAGAQVCRLGRHDEGAEQLRAALPGLGRPADRAAALLQLAGCRDRQGRRVEALAWYAEAYEACLRAGDRASRAVALRRLRTRAAA